MSFEVGDVVLIARDLNWHRGCVGRIHGVSANADAERCYFVTFADGPGAIGGGWYSAEDLEPSNEEVGTENPELLSALKKHLTVD